MLIKWKLASSLLPSDKHVIVRDFGPKSAILMSRTANYFEVFPDKTRLLATYGHVWTHVTPPPRRAVFLSAVRRRRRRSVATRAPDTYETAFGSRRTRSPLPLPSPLVV